MKSHKHKKIKVFRSSNFYNTINKSQCQSFSHFFPAFFLGRNRSAVVLPPPPIQLNQSKFCSRYIIQLLGQKLSEKQLILIKYQNKQGEKNRKIPCRHAIFIGKWFLFRVAPMLSFTKMTLQVIISVEMKQFDILKANKMQK